MSRSTIIKRSFSAALPQTLPILTGFLFLGFSYGFYMRSLGFSFLYPMLMALTIFGGSLEFVAVSMLLGSFAPLQTFLMALMIQARHLFYGISMLEKYKNTGWKKIYLIFGMCDESFSINYSASIPQDADRKAADIVADPCGRNPSVSILLGGGSDPGRYFRIDHFHQYRRA